MCSKRIVQVNRYGFRRVELTHNGLGQIYVESKFLDGCLCLPEDHVSCSRREFLRGHMFVSIDTLYCWQEEIDAQNVLRGVL